MSYYCKGEKCSRRDECLRVKAWELFSHKDTPTGFATGLWLVEEEECMSNNYSDGVFPQTASVVQLIKLLPSNVN